MSPGPVTEILYFFIAEYSKAMKINEGGGAGRRKHRSFRNCNRTDNENDRNWRNKGWKNNNAASIHKAKLPPTASSSVSYVSIVLVQGL